MTRTAGTSGMMTLSHNECNSLFRRVFEVRLGHDRDYYGGASLAVWLLACGISPVTVCLQEQTGLTDISVNYDLSASHEIVIDGGGRSFLVLGRPAFDLAIDALKQDTSRPAAVVKLKNICDAFTAVAVITSDNGPEVYSAAVWNGHLAMISKSAHFPDVFTADTQTLESDECVLICAHAQTDLDRLLAKIGVRCGPPQISASQMAMTYKDSQIGGVSMSVADYQALNEIADQILVEASEASRAGAGE